ncbi:unnamed protein product, partial [Didymodactylos carnosus]
HKKRLRSKIVFVLCLFIGILAIFGVIASSISVIVTAHSKITYTSSSTSSTSTVGSSFCSYSSLENIACIPTGYDLHTCVYTATSTNTTIIFEMQNDASSWLLDDVSVIGSSGNVIKNGEFNVTLAPWKYSNPFNDNGLSGMSNQNSCTADDSYMFEAEGAPDYLTQSFATVIGQSYTINYYLLESGGSTTSICSAKL